MKRRLSFLAAALYCVALMCLSARTALAAPAEQTAQEIGKTCAYTTSYGRVKAAALTDGSLSSSFTAQADGQTLTVAAPQGQTLAGLLLNVRQTPQTLLLSTSADGQTYTPAARFDGTAQPFLHIYLSAQTPARYLRLTMEKNTCLLSLRAYTPGRLPEEVQRWQPTVEKADLMLLAAHPDDELLFLGGVLPTYAGERNKRTVVLYMTHQKRRRQSEALDGLWAVGVRTYPVFAGFPDRYCRDKQAALDAWGGENAVLAYLVEQLRRYRPEVVVSHDVNGEYGHGAHQALAQSLQQAVQLAADASFDPDSAQAYGVWQVKKLYLHMYAEQHRALNWHVPLDAFGGKTALEVTKEGYHFHKSQHSHGYRVLNQGRTGIASWGLAYSAVGPDEQMQDLFEHIQPEPTEIPAVVPAVPPPETPCWWLLGGLFVAVLLPFVIILRRTKSEPPHPNP